MPWVTFNENDVKARMSTLEVSTYESAAKSGAEDDRLPTIISHVLGKIRGNIRANPGVPELGPEGTIPDFCVDAAAVLGRVALIGLTPVQEGMTDPRREEYRAAEKLVEALRQMSISAFSLTDPATDSSTASYGGCDILDF
jgi:hypothetical protein